MCRSFTLQFVCVYVNVDPQSVQVVLEGRDKNHAHTHTHTLSAINYIPSLVLLASQSQLPLPPRFPLLIFSLYCHTCTYAQHIHTHTQKTLRVNVND